VKDATNIWIVDSNGDYHFIKPNFVKEGRQSRICDCDKDCGLCWCIIKTKENE